MKVIIAGSRSITDYSIVEQAVEQSGFEITEVVSGAGRGVDKLGELWAAEHFVPVKRFPPDWARRKQGAPHRRNEAMAAYADALIAVWDGSSRGTRHLIETAQKQGLKVYVHRVERA